MPLVRLDEWNTRRTNLLLSQQWQVQADILDGSTQCHTEIVRCPEPVPQLSGVLLLLPSYVSMFSWIFELEILWSNKTRSSFTYSRWGLSAINIISPNLKCWMAVTWASHENHIVGKISPLARSAFWWRIGASSCRWWRLRCCSFFLRCSMASKRVSYLLLIIWNEVAQKYPILVALSFPNAISPLRWQKWSLY